MQRWMKEGLGILGGLTLVVGGAIAWQSYFGTGGGQGVTGEMSDRYRAPRPDRRLACGEVVGSIQERVRACIAETQPLSLSADARGEVDGILEGGKLLTLARPLGRESEMAVTEPLLDLLAATDEQAAAAALRDAGVRGLVVHRDLTQALDRDAVVVSRLAQHDHLEFFQLRYVTEQALIYTVRSSTSEVPVTTGAALVDGLRARLEGRPPRPQSWTPRSVSLLASLRLQGHTLLLRHSAGADIEQALDGVAQKLITRWERDVATQGHGSLSDRMGDVRIELQVITERAPVEPRSPWAIFDLFEIGVDGMILRRAKGLDDEKFTYMPGSEAVPRSLRSADAFLRHAVDTFAWNDPRPWEDPRTRLDLIRTSHFMEKSAGGIDGVVMMDRGMPRVSMNTLTDGRIRDMLVDGGEWWLTNLRPDNQINYKYWPHQNRMSDDYNEVRHILATRDLADTWRYRQDPRYLHGARRAMDWLLRYAVRDTDTAHSVLPSPPPGSMLFRYPAAVGEVPGKLPNQKLGTVAVALLGWVAWAESTGDHSEDANIEAMARYVRSQLEDNGKFQAYLVDPGHPYYNEKNDIVPGEAALALGEVAEYFNDTSWLDFYPKYLDYYEPWFRERAKRVVPNGRWPHSTYGNSDRLDLVQFGPWSVMANKQYYVMTGDERAATFGLEVADWMIDYYQWSGERSPFPDYVGGYYKLPEELPAMQSFCYSEGTAAAYHIASTFAPERKDKYDRSTREAIRFLDVMQYDPVSSYFAARPELIDGGIRYAMNEPKVRIDYVGHGLSTLSQYLDARAHDPAMALDLEVETVSYPPAVEQIWGRWRVDMSHEPKGPRPLSDEERVQWRQLAERLSFEYTPREYLERGLGRAMRLDYQVVEATPDTVVIRIPGRGAMPPRQRTLRHVDAEHLEVSEGGASQIFVRDTSRVQSVAAAAARGATPLDRSEPGEPDDDEGGE